MLCNGVGILPVSLQRPHSCHVVDYMNIITALKGQCYLLFVLCVDFCNQWLLCGVLARGLPDHPECFLYVLLALPVVVLVDGLVVPGLALGVQGCV